MIIFRNITGARLFGRWDALDPHSFPNPHRFGHQWPTGTVEANEWDTFCVPVCAYHAHCVEEKLLC